MNENLNLVEILKDCPKGTKLYSSVVGEVEFERISAADEIYPIVTNIAGFTKDGRFLDSHNGECTLFPSKDQRDWSKWEYPKPKFDPKTLRPFDKILVRYRKRNPWRCGLFSFILDETCIYAEGPCGYCVPYNEDTKYLIGTTKEAPEYYRYWEE